jgi:Peptidase family M23
MADKIELNEKNSLTDTSEKSTESKIAQSSNQPFEQAKPLFDINNPNNKFPEGLINSSEETYRFQWGNGPVVKPTAGFGEVHPSHSFKPAYKYLDSNNPDPKHPKTQPAGHSHPSIDVKFPGTNAKITPLWGGTVEFAGSNSYGKNVVILTTNSYVYNNKSYPVYTRYSHLDSIEPGIKRKGTGVDNITTIGREGRTGTKADHLDFQIFIKVDGKEIYISPNLLQENFQEQQRTGTWKSSSNESTSYLGKTASNSPTQSDTSNEANSNQKTVDTDKVYARILAMFDGSYERATEAMKNAEPPIKSSILDGLKDYANRTPQTTSTNEIAGNKEVQTASTSRGFQNA